MTLLEYMKRKNLSFRQVEKEITDIFGGSPKHSTIESIVYGTATPSLEAALMIVRWTHGAVEPHELIKKGGRRYTKDGERIYVLGSSKITRQPIEDEELLSMLS